MADREEPTEGAEPGGYEVGFRKPPRHTRFRKGQSGNPRGRPKGARNFATEVHEELSERVRITEGGRTKWVSKGLAIVKRQTQKALQGDVRAAAMLAGMETQHLKSGAADTGDEVSGEDWQIIADGLARLVRPGDAK